MKFLALFLISWNATLLTAAAAITNPLKLPAWSDLEKYQSKTIRSIPLIDKNYIAFGGLNYGFKNGIGFDGMACRKISRYLCAGARVFIGSLNSEAIVRGPTILEMDPPDPSVATAEVIGTPQSWFAFVPEAGLTVHTQIIPLGEQWSESAWFGFGKAFIGGRSGWAVSFEPGLNKKLAADSPFGWTLRAKYTFGWLQPKNDVIGTIPFDWLNLTAGVFYVW